MSNLNSLVSVIITTYNRAELIGEAIQSVLSQTNHDFELIIVDDGSTDNTRDVVEAFEDPRIRYIYTENWGGPARPRNIGIDLANGEHIAFLDSDDYWRKDKLEKQLRVFENPDIIGVGSQIVKIGDFKFDRKFKPDSGRTLDFNGILTVQSTSLSSLIIRNNGFHFDENEAFKFVEDFDFQLQLTLKTGKYIKILSEPLIYYRIHEGNETKELRNAEKHFRVLQKYSHVIPKDVLRKLYGKGYLALGIRALMAGNDDAIEYFDKSKIYYKGKLQLVAKLLFAYSRMPLKIRHLTLPILLKFPKVTSSN